MESGVPECSAGVVSDEFGALFELWGGFGFGHLFDDDAAGGSEFLFALFAVGIFALFADERRVFEGGNEHDHARAAFLDEGGEWFFDLGCESFDASGVGKCFAHIDNGAGEFVHGSDEISAGIDAALTADGADLDVASASGGDGDAVASEQWAAIAGDGISDFLFIEGSLESEGELFEVGPELVFEVDGVSVVSSSSFEEA